MLYYFKAFFDYVWSRIDEFWDYIWGRRSEFLAYMREEGFFEDDGDPAGWHFVTNSFTKDDTWRDFDLSAHVPEHAKAVLFRIRSRTTALGVDNYLRSRAKVFFANVVRMENPVANVFGEHNVVCQCDSDRFIQYKIDGVRTNVFNMVVMGWWY